jgi:hypothetical protein
MRRWHAEINPQHTMLRGSVDCAVAANRGGSEGPLSKPEPGRRR